MSLRAGFAEVDITPPLGTQKIGFKRVIYSDHVIDPLFARVAVIEAAGTQIAFVQLDTLCILWEDVREIRSRVARKFGIAPEAVMVCATHNHAGPAVADSGDARRDEAYVRTMIDRVVDAFEQALAALAPAEVGFGSGVEFRVAHNRRVVMRDGTVCTHGRFTDPNALFLEGPIDPEVAVAVFRRPGGALLGALVNYACHPTHHGAGTGLSAGYPGVLAREMKAAGCPVTLFLNGASGNVHTADPTRGGADMPMETAGRLLAETVQAVIDRVEYTSSLELACAATQIDLPYRRVTEAEIKGEVKGAQRFVDSAIYDREMPELVARIRAKGYETVEVQVLWLGERAYVSMPGELFVQLGLRIKEEAYPVRAVVVGYANGAVGYLPHAEAFRRGGYETTFCGASRMAPEAGEMLVEAALRLIRESAGARRVQGAGGRAG